MALTNQAGQTPGQSTRTWSLSHFLVRVLGLTGLLVGSVGLVLTSLDDGLKSWDAFGATLGGGNGPLDAWLLNGGFLTAILALVVELLVILSRTAARRSALGLNALSQVVLAVLLLILVNLWSAIDLKIPLFGKDFSFPAHYARIDLTRNHEFTLPSADLKELQKLQGETTVVIYQRSQTFGGVKETPDQYDAAAERKVIEKVKDLIEQLRELGKQFTVEMLNTKDEGYYDKLERLTRNDPELKKAIEAAPENSLFFYPTPGKGEERADRKVQQLSFNDFLRLDKTSSRNANNNRGNLVLSKGGVEPIRKRIVNVEQRKPRVGILVVHEALTSEGAMDTYTLAGARKVLQNHGFDVRDVVLKKGWERRSEPEAAVDNLEDSRFDRLQIERKANSRSLSTLKRNVELLTELVQMVSDPKVPLLKLNEQLFRFRLQLPNNELRPQMLNLLQEQLAYGKHEQEVIEERNQEIAKEMSQVDADRVGERRRDNDVKAKLDRILAECDVLLLPRITTDLKGDPVVRPPSLHDLDSEQVAAIKTFLLSGKPLLACFGSLNQPASDPDRPDKLEVLLRDLGVRFGNRTILFDAEKQTFLEDERSPFRIQRERVPPLELKGSAEKELAKQRTDRALRQKVLTPRDLSVLGSWLGCPLTGTLIGVVNTRVGPLALPPRDHLNPIRRSLEYTNECLKGPRDNSGSSAPNPLHLVLHKPRPVAVDPEVARQLGYETTILLTNPATWTDEHPFPSDERPVPRLQRPTEYDPDADTVDEKRQGPFAVAVALETKVPSSKWLTSAADRPKDVRLVAIGHGGVFVGKELSLAQERLLLDSCNWLLHREDRLARPGEQWQYPRVEMNAKTEAIWLWACRLGLPLVFAYLGLVALLFRRIR